jgi:hypothetical protein
VLTSRGQPGQPHILDGLADIFQLTIKIEIPQDPHHDRRARGAGTASIQHPQNHPSSELPSGLLRLDLVVQDAPPFLYFSPESAEAEIDIRLSASTTLSSLPMLGDG